VSTFEKLADLPIEVDGYTLEGLRAEVSSGFERLSTVVHLTGGGLEGVGEDVVYDALDHIAFQDAGPVHARALSGRRTLGEFSSLHQARAAYERDYILKKLDENHGNISRTAEVLGLERSHFYRKMKSLGIAAKE